VQDRLHPLVALIEQVLHTGGVGVDATSLEDLLDGFGHLKGAKGEHNDCSNLGIDSTPALIIFLSLKLEELSQNLLRTIPDVGVEV
jgi:hypothetical protein